MNSIRKVTSTWHSANVIFGSGAWMLIGILSLLAAIGIGLIEHLFLLAPLLIVPLGLALIDVPRTSEKLWRLHKFIRISQPFCAVLVITAFLLPGGILAGMLASSWLALTGLVAVLGLARLISRRNLDIEELCIDAGAIYISVGGGWLVLSRLGLNPLGFGDLIVLLTAVHFHFAGFAALIITGVTGRILTSVSKAKPKLYQFSVFGLIAGIPLVAAGITFSPLLEVTGAIITATSLAILAYLIIFFVLKVISQRLAQLLLTVSALCSIIGVLFIYAYAIGEFTGYYLVSISLMVRIHGVSNALGFALCGLLGWNILQPHFKAATNNESRPAD